MTRNSTNSNRFTENAPAEQNIDLDQNTRQMLVDMMRDLYPNVDAYKKGQLLNDSLPIEEPAEEMTLQSAPRDISGFVQVDSTDEQDKYVTYDMVSLEPDMTEDELDDYLQDSFETFTIDPVTPPATPDPVIINNVFIATGDVSLTDVHDLYLQSGPQNLNNLAVLDSIFCVFLIQDSIARPIPNYKTLEVLLVEAGLTYTDITEATDEDRAKYDLQFDGIIRGEYGGQGGQTANQEFLARQLADRSGEWGLQIRFTSGYRPKAPFMRDPGDYYATSTEDDTNPYINLVYKAQTADEKLRERFEGKLIVLNAGENDEGQINYANESALRMMINGYWKGVIDSDVLRYHNEYLGYGVVLDNDLEQSIINLIDKGGCTLLNEDAAGSPIWNAFAHISQVNFLDTNEYNDYFETTNQGRPFDLEYLQPYEPPGSVKYYSAGTTQALRNQLIEDLQALEDQADQQWSFNAGVSSMTADLEDLISSWEVTANSSIAGALAGNTHIAMATDIRNDLFNIFVTSYDTGNNSWRVTKQGDESYSDRNLFESFKNFGGSSAKMELLIQGHESWYNSLPAGAARGILVDQYYVWNQIAQFGQWDWDDLAGQIDFASPVYTPPPHPFTGNQGPTINTDPDHYWRGCISSYKMGYTWGDEDGKVTTAYNSFSDAVGNAGWMNGSAVHDGGEATLFGDSDAVPVPGLTVEPITDFVSTAFDLEMESIFLEDVDQYNAYKEQMINELEDLLVHFENWKTIPDQEDRVGTGTEAGVTIPNGMYTFGDLQTYQELLDLYTDKLGQYQEQLAELTVTPAYDQVQEAGVKYIQHAYNLIESMRSNLFNGTQGNKWSILWPFNAREIVNKYLPYGDQETEAIRFEKYIYGWQGGTTAAPEITG
jgi:hypothetical protein